MRKTTRKMGLFLATGVIASNMMSSGISMIPSYVAEIGSITLLSWLITGVGALCLGYIFARLGIEDPQTGGIVAYAEEVSPLIGFQSAVLYIYSNWIGNIGIAITGVSYLSSLFPVLDAPIPAAVLAVGVIWILVCVNLLGAKWMSSLATFGLICVLAPVLLTILYGWSFFDIHLFWQNWNTDVHHHHEFNLVMAGVTICLWGFSGLESASTNATLTAEPSKTIPKATMIGIGIALCVYFFSSNIMLGIFPAETLVKSGASYALATSLFLGDWAGHAVVYLTAFACFTSLGSWMMMLGQASIRAGRTGALPRVFAEVNDKNIAPKGVLIQASFMTTVLFILAFFSNDVHELFSHAVAICILLLAFPYFYVILNYLYRAQTPFSHITLSKKMTCFFAALFCLSAFMGARRSELETAIILFLMIFLFYSKIRSTKERPH